MTRSQAIVVKLGGEVVAGEFLEPLAADIAELAANGERVVVVHGGGPQATALQKKLGQTPNIVAGRRITDRETLEVMKMTVAGAVNVDLCAALLAAGARPVGLNGASSRAIAAEKRPPRVVSGAGPDPIDFGHVGDVTGINLELIEHLLRSGYVPVLACLGADARGNILNINADIVANQTAIALTARALVLISDVRGVYANFADPSSRIARLSVADGKKAIESGVVKKGMIPKLEESFAAIAAGVRAVHITGSLRRGELAREIESPGSIGTVLVS